MSSFMQHRIVTGCFFLRIGSAHWSPSSSGKARCKRTFPTAVNPHLQNFTGILLLILLASMQGQISYMKQPCQVPGIAVCSVLSLSTDCMERPAQPTLPLLSNLEDKMDMKQLSLKSQLTPVADPIYSTNKLLVGGDPECHLALQKPNKLIAKEAPTEYLTTAAEISAGNLELEVEVEVERNVSKTTIGNMRKMALVMKEPLEIPTTSCFLNEIQNGFQVRFR